MKTLITLILILIPFICHGAGIMMIGGSSGSTCDPATEYVGSKTTSASAWEVGANSLYCSKYTASCTGTMGYAWAYHNSTADDTTMICVYTADAGTPPDSGDAKMACSDAIVSGSSTGNKKSGSKMSGTNTSVTSGTSYWVCMLPSSSHWDSTYEGSGATVYYDATWSFAYPTTPSDLTAIHDDYFTRKQIPIWVEIE